MKGLETVILSSSLAAWSVGILAQIGILRWNLTFELELYPLYILAAFTGWFFGNVYVHRSGRERRFAGRALDEVILQVARTRLLFVLYLFGPPGWLYLIRSMARREQLEGMPLVGRSSPSGCTRPCSRCPFCCGALPPSGEKFELGGGDD